MKEKRKFLFFCLMLWLFWFGFFLDLHPIHAVATPPVYVRSVSSDLPSGLACALGGTSPPCTIILPALNTTINDKILVTLNTPSVQPKNTITVTDTIGNFYSTLEQNGDQNVFVHIFYTNSSASLLGNQITITATISLTDLVASANIYTGTITFGETMFQSCVAPDCTATTVTAGLSQIVFGLLDWVKGPANQFRFTTGTPRNNETYFTPSTNGKHVSFDNLNGNNMAGNWSTPVTAYLLLMIEIDPPFSIEGPYTIATGLTGLSGGLNILGYASNTISWFSDGRYWVAYCKDAGNTSPIQYVTSTNRITWSSPASLSTTLTNRCQYAALVYDSSRDFVHYFLAVFQTVNGFYRMGIPQSDGTITWQAAEQNPIVEPAGYEALEGQIDVDGSGFPFIAVEQTFQADTTQSGAQVWKSSTNNGLWTTQASFPFQLNTTKGQIWAQIDQLASNKMLAGYFINALGSYRTRAWSGSTWGSEEDPTAGTSIRGVMRSSSSRDESYAIWSNSGIRYMKRTTSWTAPSIILSSASASPSAAPSAAIRASTLWTVWRESGGQVYGLSQDLTTGIWDTQKTLLFSDASIASSSEIVANSLTDGRIAIVYTSGTGTGPFSVKIAFLGSEIPVALANISNAVYAMAGLLPVICIAILANQKFVVDEKNRKLLRFILAGTFILILLLVLARAIPV